MTRQKRRGGYKLDLDCDKVGLFCASLMAAVVLLFCWWRGVSGLETAVRVSVAAAVTYPVAFLFVFVLHAVADKELKRIQRDEWERQASPEPPAAAETAEEHSAAAEELEE